MRAKRENCETGPDSSLRILQNPNLNDIFYWHFHPEYEIVYVESPKGLRHIGNHISNYEGSDLALIGPNIPHLNFDYGVKNKVETVVIQMREDFLGDGIISISEFGAIRTLLELAKEGLVFYGDTKLKAGTLLKEIRTLPHFEKLIRLLQVLQLLANSDEKETLHVKPVSVSVLQKENQRLQQVYQFIELHYQQSIDVKDVARLCSLTTAAFCRYFKKATHFTFTEFLNQYRINQAKKLLLYHQNITNVCFECGFGNISHFNKTFKAVTGVTPSVFRKHYLNS
ncbi:AraC family transcriptional regulator [Hydrotalea sp.]|uniref:helix-turn-helix domain-containing protein n=1 Tax=Hydrotalea sp. TaxID=2881279 RepID=UPI0025903F47|nr:AraC family transcriptional regulator [Hydrotalea sp.]